MDVQIQKWLFGQNIDRLFQEQSLFSNLIQVSLDFHLRFPEIQDISKDVVSGCPGVFGQQDHPNMLEFGMLTNAFNSTELSDEFPDNSGDASLQSSETALGFLRRMDSGSQEKPNQEMDRCRRTIELKDQVFREFMKSLNLDAIGEFVDSNPDPANDQFKMDRTVKKTKMNTKKQSDVLMMENQEMQMFYKIFKKI